MLALDVRRIFLISLCSLAPACAGASFIGSGASGGQGKPEATDPKPEDSREDSGEEGSVESTPSVEGGGSLEDLAAGASLFSTSGVSVEADKCEGELVGDGDPGAGLCQGKRGFYKDIVFPVEFASPPKVVVATELDMTGPACAASTKINSASFAEKVTTKGFRMFCTAVPDPRTSCGEAKGRWGRSICRYQAFGTPKDPNTPPDEASGFFGADIIATVTPGDCQGGADRRGLCATPYTQKIRFPASRGKVPTVLASLSIASPGDGCAKGSSVQDIVSVSDVTKDGFTLSCGSVPHPLSECGDLGATPWGKASCTYVVYDEAARRTGRVETSTGTLASTCSGTLDRATGICKGAPYSVTVTFKTPFSKPPLVVTTLTQAMAGTSNVCAAGTTDRNFVQAANVTKEGFTLICASSPEQGLCGSSHDGWGASKCSWAAFGL